MDPLVEFVRDVCFQLDREVLRNDLHNAKVIVRRNEYLINELLDQLARMYRSGR